MDAVERRNQIRIDAAVKVLDDYDGEEHSALAESILKAADEAEKESGYVYIPAGEYFVVSNAVATSFYKLSDRAQVEALAMWLCMQFDAGAWSGVDEDGQTWWDDILLEEQRDIWRASAGRLIRFIRGE